MNGGDTVYQSVLKEGSRPAPDKVNRKVSHKCHNQRTVKSAIRSRHLKSFYAIKPKVAQSYLSECNPWESATHLMCLSWSSFSCMSPRCLEIRFSMSWLSWNIWTPPPGDT